MQDPTVNDVHVWSIRFPTPEKESDGTLEWDHVSVVLVEVCAGDLRGYGWAYAEDSAAGVVATQLKSVVIGAGIVDVDRSWRRMLHALRNSGASGVGMSAMSAMDIALWDLKARYLQQPLVNVLGAVRDDIPAYGSGGFTSYSDDELASQFAGWSDEGFEMVKMKIGRDDERDLHRISVARDAIGEGVALFVDANGAYDARRALRMAHSFVDFGVQWFEEPVSSDDLDSLRFVREYGPFSIAVAAGEYGDSAWYFRRMIDAGAVDVLQADATRCGGITGFLQADALCWAANVLLSAHTSPTVHTTLCCASQRAVHVEYFIDHVRIEHALFDGASTVRDGRLTPDRSRPGLGIDVRWADFAHLDAQQLA